MKHINLKIFVTPPRREFPKSLTIKNSGTNMIGKGGP
jgi:hypothetical protein